jgi:hypothetical protein
MTEHDTLLISMDERPAGIHSDCLERQLHLVRAVEARFRLLFVTHRERLRGVQRCLDRFRSAVGRLESDPTIASLWAVDESHNELCAVEELLRFDAPAFSSIEYEPRLPAGERRIDLCATAREASWYVEVKTIRPEVKDRWDQYRAVVEAGRITPNVTIHFERDWMGGELWHNRFSARSKMLEYSIDFEARILAGGIDAPENRFVLALCSDGFSWHEDELEDFVAFYRTGRHRLDDGLSRMEQHALRGKTLTRRISAFAYFCRPAFEPSIVESNWDVQPPLEPWLSNEPL